MNYRLQRYGVYSASYINISNYAKEKGYNIFFSYTEPGLEPAAILIMSDKITVADILMITFGMIVITVGVPILLCVIGTFLFGFVLLILEWLADNFWL